MVTDFGFVMRLLGISQIVGFALFSGRATMMMMCLMALRMRDMMILRRMAHQGPHIWRSMARHLYTLQTQLQYRLLRWL
jgi:hypothetical protein